MAEEGFGFNLHGVKVQQYEGRVEIFVTENPATMSIDEMKLFIRMLNALMDLDE